MIATRTLITTLLIAVSATMSLSARGQDAGDPLQSINRPIFQFNDAVDRWVLKPVAQGYDRFTPDPVQERVTNVFENLQAPAIALNQLLQGKPKRGLSDLTRFLVNSTVGLGGMFDVAGRNGLPRHDEDFGQTFAVWAGGRQGAYLTLPFRGPASVSHAVGMVFDGLTNPLRLVSPRRDQLLLFGLDVIDTRASLLTTEQLISGDRYLFIRDAYLQSRAFEISDGEMEDDPFLDDF